MRYRGARAPAAHQLTVSDEARAIRDHDGDLHRIVGIVRASAPDERA